LRFGDGDMMYDNVLRWDEGEGALKGRRSKIREWGDDVIIRGCRFRTWRLPANFTVTHLASIISFNAKPCQIHLLLDYCALLHRI
jgi:hypothetical protein